MTDPSDLKRPSLKKQGTGISTSWQDTNVGLIGTEEDKALRKAAASIEAAWKGVGLKGGLCVWRIEHFDVVAVEESTYGQFHKGDSYIVLNTVEGEGGVCTHDIFFLLGTETSVDEQGTAAYKTVELDDFFDGEPTQHREVMGEESAEFKALFSSGTIGEVTYLDGGVDSGFKHVVPEGYDTKMYQVRKVKGKTQMHQVPLHSNTIHKADCYIMDSAEFIYVLEGEASSPFERTEANVQAERIELNRASSAKVTHEIDDGFWALLEGPPLKKGFCGAATVSSLFPEGTYVEVTAGEQSVMGLCGVVEKEVHDQGKPSKWRVMLNDGRSTWVDAVKKAEGEKPEEELMVSKKSTGKKTTEMPKVKVREYKAAEKEEGHDPSIGEGSMIEVTAGKSVGSKGKVLKVMNMRYRVELEDGSTTWADKVKAV